MTDRHFTPREALDGFVEATHWWAEDVLPRAATFDLDQPGLGVWTVRELIAHTTRAFKTTVEYADPAPATGPALLTAAGYFRAALAKGGPDINDAVAERARREAAEEPDVITAALEWADAALQVVGGQLPGSTAHSLAGDMRFDQYLTTRVVELVVHGMDLAAAVDAEVAPPPGPASMVLTLLIEVAPEVDAPDLLRSLTGRSPLPGGYSVFG